MLRVCLMSLPLLVLVAGCGQRPSTPPETERTEVEAMPEAKSPAPPEAKAGPEQPGEKTDPLAERIEQAGQIADVAERVAALLAIAKEQAGAGEQAAAQKTFDRAAEECVRSGSPDQRVRLLLEVAQARHAGGDAEGAGTTLTAALTAAGKAPPGQRIPLMAEAARAQAELGNKPGAVKTLQEAASLVEAVKKDEDKIRGFGAIAGAYHALGETAGAKETIGAALDLTTAIVDDRLQCEALAEVAVQQMPLDAEAAGRKFDVSLSMAGDIEDPFNRARTLASIAEKLSRAGRPDQARKVLQQAEEAASQIPEENYRRRMQGTIQRLKEQLPPPQQAPESATE